MTIAGFRVLNIRSPFIVTLVRGKHRTMSPIDPPLEVRGVTEWRPELFNTSVLIPRLSVKSEQVGPVKKMLEKYLLKVANLKPIQECDRSKDRRTLLLNPDLVSSFRDLDDHVKDLSAADIDSQHFRQELKHYSHCPAELTFLQYSIFKTECVTAAS